jgi:pimeloyl-ACP methyl ester carboxylesterase
VAPLPYGVQQVVFHNAGVRLAGTLTLPRTPGPHPAIVLVPGSGEVDRDGSLFGHQFYLVLADDLTRRGFAVLRSDKRGIGQSGGDFASATSLDFAADIGAGVAFLRSRPEIDGGRIGLVGHSEGALVGSIVAARDPGIAFLVLMAGNGIPAAEMLRSRTPTPPMTPWLRTLLTLDPQAPLRRLHCPVLALVGDKDRIVTADENIPALRTALSGNPKAQVQRLPGLNHFFQTARTGDFSEVATIEETISPQALALIGAWAGEASKRAPSGARRTPGSNRQSRASSPG